MTTNEAKLIKQTLKGFVDSGLISDGTMQEIANIKEQDGKQAGAELITRKEALVGIPKFVRNIFQSYNRYGDDKEVKTKRK